jgi:outer membrane protein
VTRPIGPGGRSALVVICSIATAALAATAPVALAAGLTRAPRTPAAALQAAAPRVAPAPAPAHSVGAAPGSAPAPMAMAAPRVATTTPVIVLRQSAPAATAAAPAPVAVTGVTTTRRLQGPAPATGSGQAPTTLAASLPATPRAATPAGTPVVIAALPRDASSASPVPGTSAPAVTGPLAATSDEAPSVVPALPSAARTAAAPPAEAEPGARAGAVTIGPDPAAPQPVAPRAAPVATAPAPVAITPATPVAVTPAPTTPPAAIPAATAQPGGPARIGPETSATGAPTPAPVPAAEGATLTVTPESAAALALQNSLDLQISAASVREAQAKVRQAYGLDDLNLTASALLARKGPVATVTINNETMTLGSPDVRNFTLSLSKPLYTGGRLEQAQRLAKLGVEVQTASAGIVRHGVDLAAREAVYNTLRLEQLTNVAQQAAGAVAAHLDLSRKLMDAGVVARFEVVQAETELARAQGNLISARTAVENAKAGIRRLLTVPQVTALQVDPGQESAVPEGDQAALIALACQRRPEVQSGEVAVRLAEANVGLARKTSALSVALVGSATMNLADVSFGSTDYGWQVGLTAEQPILNGHATRDKVAEAKAQLDAARLSVEKTRQEVALEVTQALLALDQAREQLTVARQAQLQAEEQLRIAKVRYESGVALGVEVLDAEASLTAARGDVVNASYSVEIATTDLRAAVGQ